MRGKLQLISSSSCLIEDRERADALVVKLLLWPWEVKIGRVQPDLVADLIVARRPLLLVVLALHVGCCLPQRFAGFPMNVAHRGDEIGRRWVGDGIIIFGVGDESWVSSIEDHEGAVARSAMGPIVVRELCKRQPVGPVTLSVVNEDPEVFLNLLINSFSLAICLWMPGGQGVWSDVKQSVKFLHES